jgi:hypothetical protein
VVPVDGLMIVMGNALKAGCQTVLEEELHVPMKRSRVSL